jgi:hypothetical protein
MPQPERFDVLVLGSGTGGKLIAWHMARDVFLRGGLEVLGHRLLEAPLVLPDHAGHAVELVDAPFVGAGDA